MNWLILLIGSAVFHIHAASQVQNDVKEMEIPSEQDLIKEIVLGRRAIEPPEEEGKNADIDPEIGTFFNHAQIGRATRSTGDPPAPMNAEPAAMLEEDRDHIYHAHNEAEGGKVPIEEMILLPDMVNGLEEDRDHLYHDNREM
ncbi:hypothetical protein Y1Q_0005152 [Alligator mississippiensis]|uniref:Uncharacterized protein n=1 Tax=Alligator mississippiensis TaxID=8496 RepID=A0A151MSU4_ALLMI|nr:hypothetical protein Y1Q_0005152 [Alligator mississippiensis]